MAKKKSEDKSERLFKLIAQVSYGETQILGGTSGVHGMTRGLREDLMKKTAIIAAKIKDNKLTDQETEEYLALCSTAVATNVLSQTDFEEIETIVTGA